MVSLVKDSRTYFPYFAVLNVNESFVAALMTKISNSYIPTRDLRSSKKKFSHCAAFNLNSYGHRAFCVTAPLLWNNLPRHIRDAGTLDIFKRQLMTFLF